LLFEWRDFFAAIDALELIAGQAERIDGSGRRYHARIMVRRCSQNIRTGNC
jgi:hypothetical protein